MKMSDSGSFPSVTALKRRRPLKASAEQDSPCTTNIVCYAALFVYGWYVKLSASFKGFLLIDGDSDETAPHFVFELHSHMPSIHTTQFAAFNTIILEFASKRLLVCLFTCRASEPCCPGRSFTFRLLILGTLCFCRCIIMFKPIRLIHLCQQKIYSSFTKNNVIVKHLHKMSSSVDITNLNNRLKTRLFFRLC